MGDIIIKVNGVTVGTYHQDNNYMYITEWKLDPLGNIKEKESSVVELVSDVEEIVSDPIQLTPNWRVVVPDDGHIKMTETDENL